MGGRRGGGRDCFVGLCLLPPRIPQPLLGPQGSPTLPASWALGPAARGSSVLLVFQSQSPPAGPLGLLQPLLGPPERALGADLGGAPGPQQPLSLRAKFPSAQPCRLTGGLGQFLGLPCRQTHLGAAGSPTVGWPRCSPPRPPRRWMRGWRRTEGQAQAEGAGWGPVWLTAARGTADRLHLPLPGLTRGLLSRPRHEAQPATSLTPLTTPRSTAPLTPA